MATFALFNGVLHPIVGEQLRVPPQLKPAREKRHQMKHLDFLIACVEVHDIARGSPGFSD